MQPFVSACSAILFVYASQINCGILQHLKFMIRKYHPADRRALIEILKLNTPTYFDLNEVPDYEAYLGLHEYSTADNDGSQVWDCMKVWRRAKAFAHLKNNLIHKCFVVLTN
jgi:hypothetical protein